MENKIKLFENKVVRSYWDAEQEEWYFSVVDVIEVLTESKDAKQYLKKNAFSGFGIKFQLGYNLYPT